MPPGRKLQGMTPGPEGLRRHRSFCYLTVELFLKNGYPQIFIGYFGEKKREGGGVWLPSDLFWLLKTELELSISNQMSPLQSL